MENVWISSIYKKGNKDNGENYRGLSVTPTLSRVYGKIIKNRIETEFRDLEAEEQAGFRTGRSTVDHLYAITQIIEKKTAFDQGIYMLFVDLKKAYDSIPLNRLWETLEKTNIHNGIIKAVKNLYEGSTAQVKTKISRL